MKKIYLALLLVICSLSISCNDDALVSGNNQKNSNPISDITILQARNPSLPATVKERSILPSSGRSRAFNESGAIIGNSDAILGYSYKVGNSFLGDYENVGDRIIDIDFIKKLSSANDYITSKAIQKYIPEQHSYSDMDSYESFLSKTKKIHSGFSVNLGLFKLGRKKKITETFRSFALTTEKNVYGELNLMYKNSSFNLQTSDGALKLYSRECLSPAFIKNLYSSTISNMLDSYGDFVLTGYVTGGKALALYAGETKDRIASVHKEEKMNNSINATYSWKKTPSDSIGGSFKFGKGNFSTDSTSFGITKLYTRLWMFGGVPDGISMNSANDIEKISFNLEPWVTTLLNSKTHTIIDLTENGLVPMSDIVLEENYKKRMNYTSSQIVSKRPHLTMPKIEIMRVLERYSSTGEALYDIAPVLITRQGDRIILRMKPAASISDIELKRNENSEVFTQKALAIKEQKGNFYELEITANPIARLNPSATSDKYICVDLKYMDEKNMAVYTNNRTGMQYIYDRQNRIAFSHYIDELDGDWILDEYGIRTWVESLPTKNISMASLASSYHIIGL